MTAKNSPPTSWNKKRSVFAVAAGFVVTFVAAIVLAFILITALPGLYPDFHTDSTVVGGTVGGRLLNVLSMLVASIGGGYTGALLAGRAPVNHGLAVGLLMIFASFAGGSNIPASQPVWSTVILSLAFLLGGGIGGRLRDMQRTRRSR
ncbi:MAG: hypothetical protein O7D32_07830 [bacterium]|nr:hypothetical protein [bacterium]